MKPDLIHSKDFERIQKISILLDSKFKGPLGIHFGLDFLVGLIPKLGNIITTIISFYIVFVSIKLKVSKLTLLKMLMNIVVENTASLIPILGNLFDLYWKSNQKNIELLKRDLM